MPWPWLVFVRLQRVNHFCGFFETTGGWERSKLGEATVDCAIVCHMNSIPKESRHVAFGFLNTHDVRSPDQFVDNGQNRYQTESKKWIKIPNFLSKFQLGWLPPTPNLRDRLAVFFEVTELVLSIYTRRERVAEAEELLLCSSHLPPWRCLRGGWRIFGASRRLRCVLKTWNIW